MLVRVTGLRLKSNLAVPCRVIVSGLARCHCHEAVLGGARGGAGSRGASRSAGGGVGSPGARRSGGGAFAQSHGHRPTCPPQPSRTPAPACPSPRPCSRPRCPLTAHSRPHCLRTQAHTGACCCTPASGWRLRWIGESLRGCVGCVCGVALCRVPCVLVEVARARSVLESL